MMGQGLKVRMEILKLLFAVYRKVRFASFGWLRARGKCTMTLPSRGGIKYSTK